MTREGKYRNQYGLKRGQKIYNIFNPEIPHSFRFEEYEVLELKKHSILIRNTTTGKERHITSVQYWVLSRIMALVEYKERLKKELSKINNDIEAHRKNFIKEGKIKENESIEEMVKNYKYTQEV